MDSIAENILSETSSNGNSSQETKLPTINAEDSNLKRITEKTWKFLLEANRPPFLFRYGGLASRIETDDDGGPIIKEITETRMRHILARVIRWYKTKKVPDIEKKVAIDALPPMAVVRDILATPDMPLPILTRIIRAPIFAPDGALQTDPGYSESSKTFYLKNSLEIPLIPQRPSLEDIKEAKNTILDSMLGQFPFASEAEKAHAVALLLLPFIREMIRGATPLHLIEAPSPGSGKTLLSEILTIPAAGGAPNSMTEGRDEDEWRKRLTAKLRNAPTTILIDNVRHRLESSQLASVITATVWEDRMLGRTETLRLPVRCSWVATANNPGLSGEMARRCIRIRIIPAHDRPWLRNGFKIPDLRRWTYTNRGKLIWSALVLIKTWIARGKTPGEKALGMFEHWAYTLGGILNAADIPGFLGNLEEFYDASDTEGETWRNFVASWWEKFQTTAVGVKALFDLAEDFDLGKGTEKSQQTKLGFRLKEARERQFRIDDKNEFRIMPGGKEKRAQQWFLLRVCTTCRKSHSTDSDCLPEGI